MGGGGGGGGGGVGHLVFCLLPEIYWQVSMRIIAAQEGGRFVSLS